MLLLLTYFHMYWRLSVLKDLFIKYMGSMDKRRNSEKHKVEMCKEIKEEGPPTHQI
jgi:hypothetical protein